VIGKTLGHYQITDKLGEGGMGVVYKARDTHLDRFVAIKVLAAEKVADPDRKRRFAQEAKAASALNHPNIVHVYDIDQADGTDYMAMEYVEGKTLAQLIPRRGMQLGEALKYAVQIADALARAHGAGIVHRDLKPSNIMIDEHGLVKVLDFGLAKLAETAPSGGDETTRTVEATTEKGTIVGTTAYMSPEQAAGRKVDARSDIFSFGSVLYEMVTGRRAFEADSKFSTLAAVIERDPASLAGEVPYDLEKIVTRCLRKDPERRFQHMHDLKVLLQEFKEDSDSGRVQQAPVAAKQAKPMRLVIGVVAAVAVIVVAVAGWYWLSRQRSGAQEAQLTVVPLTTYRGYEWSPSFSPDGKQVAFMWCTEGKQSGCDIYVKQIGQEPPQRLTTDPAMDFGPAWSPDGEYIAFLRQRSPNQTALMLIPQRGGQEQLLSAGFDLSKWLYIGWPFLNWSPDSKWLVVAWQESGEALSGLSLFNVKTREMRPLTQGTDDYPAFSPDGRTLLFLRSEGPGLMLLRLGENYQPQGEPQKVGVFYDYTQAAWTPDGKEIVFSSFLFGRGLWRMSASSSAHPRKVPVGEDRRIDDPAVSRQGNRLAYRVSRDDTNIWRVALESPGGNAGTPTQVIASTWADGEPDYSPDGKRIAFASDRSGTPELWVCNADGSNAVKLTSFGGGSVWEPLWSRDGRSIAFHRDPSEVYTISAEGGVPRLMKKGEYPFWSWDGQWLYFRNRGLWKMPAMGGKAIQVTKEFNADRPQESPDGKTIYYAKPGVWPTCSVWKMPVAGGDGIKIIDSAKGSWKVERQGIYYFSLPDGKGREELRVYNFATGTVRKILSVDRPADGPSVSPDGRSIIYMEQDQSGSDLMLVENFR